MFQIHLADLDALIPKTSNLFCSGLAIALATEEALVCQRAEAAEEQGGRSKRKQELRKEKLESMHLG